MKRWLPLCLAALVAGPLAGCSIYFGDGDDDVCVEPPVFEGEGRRNPHNGQCELIGGGGGNCGGGGGEMAFEAPVAFDWGNCPSFCEQLGEQECLASAECHATYTDCAPGGDCTGAWQFNECWDLPPSGGNYGTMCEGLDAESCNRNADCVSNYHNGDSGEGYPGGGGPLSYDSCAPEGENHGGCFSQADCADGTVCTADTECLPPPGCMPGEVCPDVCFGHCVPGQDSCAGVDCAPGYQCEEQCMSCDPNGGPCDPHCAPACVPVGGGACDATTCPMGQHCEEVCHPCDPPPGGECPPIACDVTCVPDGPPPVCENVMCPQGSHCEVECTVTADGQMVCEQTCVPDGSACAATTCAPGTECVETCAPPPGCMGGPIGCPPVCTVACVPVNPAACELLVTEDTCQAHAACEPVYTATCTQNPDGTFDCNGFMFTRCQEQ